MIGIFDSGIGGLTVVKEIKKQLPSYKLVYFGDTARLPYGTKSKETILRYSIENSNFLFSKGAKLVVVACNSASALAGDELKKYLELPVFDVINPAVKASVAITKNRKIGVIGTPSTIMSGVYQEKLKGFEVFVEACPLFVPFVEENWIQKPETYSIAEYYLKPLKKSGIDTLILACTHYPLLQKVIHDIMGKEVGLVNPAEQLAKELRDFIKENRIALSRGESQFFVSDEPYRFQRLSRAFLGEKVEVRKVSHG